MLNIFKNPKSKKREVITQHQSGNTDSDNLLIKQFNGLNIQVYGTYEEPLFKAKDIGELLEIKKIRTSLDNLDDNCKVLKGAHTRGGLQEQWFLTEDGLYELLFISRKPIAKKFRVWVRNIIKEIRLKGKYDLEEKLKEHQQLLQAKEQELIKYREKTYEAIEKSGHIYVIKTDGGTKVGKTKDTVTKRIRGLQTGNMNDIEVLLDFETSNPDLLEKCVHYILDRYRCNSNREFFDCDVNYIKTIVEICGNVIDTLKSTYQHISKEELVEKLKNNGLEIDIEEECDSNEQVNNDFYKWLEENIGINTGSILKLQDTIEVYIGKKISRRQLGKYRKEMEKYIKERYTNVDWEYKQFWVGDIKYKGWQNLQILDK